MASFKAGDTRADGCVFDGYRKTGGERWASPTAYHRSKIQNAKDNARHRALKQGVPFDLDIGYLCELYPADGRCPALGTELSWGDASGRASSPSLDRIVPERGYVVGNVRWLSQLANQIKTNATTAEICAVADFLRKNDY